MSSLKVVVVGNGPVGFRVLNSIKSLAGKTHLRLTAFGEESLPSYDRIHLSECFGDKSIEDLVYQPREWYREQGIELITGDRIVEIDRDQQVVHSEQERAVPYDKLILATGSRPYVPEIPGRDLPGVFVYRTVEDVQKIQEFASGCRSGVVIGGGLLGLEAARALTQCGVAEVHVVESSPYVMARQLDTAGSTLLKEKIETLSYQVHTNHIATSIEDRTHSLNIQFKNGHSIETQMVIIAAGIRPRDELARNCGLEVAPRGGVVVNDFMQTSDPAIYACGECVTHQGIVYGLVAPGYEMADVVADQICASSKKKQLTFSYGDLSTELKLLEIDVATLGESLNPRQGFEEIVYTAPGIYRKLTILGRRLVGGMSVGEWDQRHRIRDAVTRSRILWPWEITRFRKTGNLWKDVETPPVQQWPDRSVICTCTGVTKGEITSAIRELGSDLTLVRERTGASTVCGSCTPLVASLCDSKVVVAQTKQRLLLTASIVTLIGIFSVLAIGPAPVPASVREPQWFDQFLLSEFWKQVTGFSLLGVTGLATLFSLRKRINRFQWGTFTSWRAFHAWMAGLTLLGLYWHTGFRSGSNLNFALFITFISANLLGSLTGLVTAMETNTNSQLASFGRSLRPLVTLTHIVGLWPLPVLIAFHIASAYLFN